MDRLSAPFPNRRVRWMLVRTVLNTMFYTE
jgi:hypothetical protein